MSDTKHSTCEEPEDATENLKLSVARTLKWNVIDRVSSQILYAVTGVVLAQELSHEEFGLVGAIMVFQMFAERFIESGFASALLQRKSPSRLDYSTVLWFNLSMALALYLLLFILAPWIADIFQGNTRLIPLSRVMFLTFIINSLSIVQSNRLIKRMETRMVAVSNSLGLIAGAVTGIYLAVSGYGAWALVWQSITVATVKTIILWFSSGWTPMFAFSFPVLKSFFRIGSVVMFTSLLNTAFQSIGSFLIGSKVNLSSLGYYTQADKWSKMAVVSISQVFASSFVPLLSKVQDDPERYAHMCGKTHRFAAYLLFPGMCLLAVMATPIFHTLFGTKWDPSIILFQLMLIRGIFFTLSNLYGNFLLSVARSKRLIANEVIRDTATIIAILITLPYIAITAPGNPVRGVEIFLWGQLAATIVTWITSLILVIRISGRTLLSYLGDLLPYFALTCLSLIPCIMLLNADLHPLLICVLQSLAFMAIYLGINALMKSRIQSDMLGYLFGRFRKAH